MTVSSVTNFSPADSSPAPQGPRDSGSGDLFSDMLRSQLTPQSDSTPGNDSTNNSTNARADGDRASASASTQNDPSPPPSNPATDNSHDSSANETAKSADNSQSDPAAADSANAKADKADTKSKADKADAKSKGGKADDSKNDPDAQAAVAQTAATAALVAIAGIAPPAADTANASAPAKGDGDASAKQAAATAAGLTPQASANANAQASANANAQASANANAQASALTPVTPAAAGTPNSTDPSQDTDDQNAGQSADPKAGAGFGQLAADVTVVDASKTLVSKPPASRAPVRSDDAAASNSQQEATALTLTPNDKSATADKTAGDSKASSDGTASIHIDSLQQLMGSTESQQKATTDASQPNQNQQQAVNNTVLAPGTIVHGPDIRTDASTLALLHGAQPNVNTPLSVANLDQVAVQITKAATDGLDKINIQLKPESLGRIDVQLQVAHNGQVNAVIAADRQDTLDLLRRDAGTLQQALNDAGLRADSGSLSFNLSNQGQNSLPQSFSNSAPAGVPDIISSDTPALSSAAIAYSAAAARGGIDIQV